MSSLGVVSIDLVSFLPLFPSTTPESSSLSIELGSSRRNRAIVIVPDGVTSPETDPLRDRAVLLLRLGELLLRTERLVALQLQSC